MDALFFSRYIYYWIVNVCECAIIVVKLNIKSFTILEFFVDLPKTTIISSLKANFLPFILSFLYWKKCLFSKFWVLNIDFINVTIVLFMGISNPYITQEGKKIAFFFKSLSHWTDCFNFLKIDNSDGCSHESSWRGFACASVNARKEGAW